MYDGATPSGNSVAVLNLLRLARLTGDAALEDLAEKQMQAFAGDISTHLRAYTYFLTALYFALGPAREIVITGQPESKEVKEMTTAVQREFLPNTVLVMRPENGNGEGIEEIIPFVKEQRAIEGRATAYVCENFACQSPTTDMEKLLTVIKN